MLYPVSYESRRAIVPFCDGGFGVSAQSRTDASRRERARDNRLLSAADLPESMAWVAPRAEPRWWRCPARPASAVRRNQ
jgi:hypothetical protein